MQKTNELWSDLGGMVACRDHLGGYATYALEDNPRLRKIETPITVWRKLSKADLEPSWYPSFEWTNAQPFCATQDEYEAQLVTCPVDQRVTYVPTCESCDQQPSADDEGCGHRTSVSGHKICECG